MPETTETTLGFPLKGTLRRSPFPKLVRQLARTKSTGSLYLLNGKTKKVVFFSQGEPISVRSNVTAECLGQILAREGLITQAQCDQTLESIRRTGKKQGELLVEMGILSEGNLRYGLEAQLRHKLYDVFSWDDGRYQYKPDVEGDDYGLRFSNHVQGMIINALLETTDEAHANRSLEGFAERFPVIDPEQEVKLEVAPEEDYFLSCLDGSKSIAELLATPFDPVVPSTALLLYASIQAGVARLAKSRREPREALPKPADGRVKPDSKLAPDYKPTRSVTAYEDTPLPGQLPKPDDEHLDAGDDFGVDAGDLESEVQIHPRIREVSSALIAAERDTPDETFGEDLDLAAGDDAEQAEQSDPSMERDAIGQPLAADPAETGVFELVLLDDDDDKPFEQDSEDAAPEPDAPPDLGLTEPEPEPEPPALESAALADVAVDDEPDQADELEEIEELEDIEELVDLDEVEDDGALEDDDPLGELSDPSLPSGLPAPVSEPQQLAAQAPELPADLAAPLATDEDEDDLAALAADLEADDDLALDRSLSNLSIEAVANALENDPDEDLEGLDGDLEGDLEGLEGDLEGLDGDLEGLEGEQPAEPAALVSDPDLEATMAVRDELMDLDELDDIDLGDSLPLDPDDAATLGAGLDYDPDATETADAETLGAMQFADGEFAIAESRWDQAIVHLEAAYEHGVDVAELHTYLAWARFQASGQSPEMADHALELLAYAQDMNPNISVVFAYRSAVLLSIDDQAGAQDAAQQALDIDPYDELAIDVMDKLV
jgi:hypothetical protein